MASPLLSVVLFAFTIWPENIAPQIDANTMPLKTGTRLKSELPSSAVKLCRGPILWFKDENAQQATKHNRKDGSEMVLIPAGEFVMGSNHADNTKPERKVYLTAYYIYKNLVTVAQYRQFCDATKRAMPNAPKWGWKDDHPIVNVTWEDANAYCKWAGGHLPTEAQWEKAARGVDGREYPWGNKWDDSLCQHSHNMRGDAGSTTPVSYYPLGASPYGCLDMAGNVWQWCADGYVEDYYKSAPYRNPTGPRFGKVRVLRGGAWHNTNPDNFRAAYRNAGYPSEEGINTGFRCAM